VARIKGGSLFLRRAFGQERYWSFPLSLCAYRRLLPSQSSCSPTLLLPQTLCCSAVNLNTADPARVRNLGTSRGRQRPSSLPPLAELAGSGAIRPVRSVAPTGPVARRRLRLATRKGSGVPERSGS